MECIVMDIQIDPEQEPVGEEQQQELHELGINILTENSKDICLDDMGDREQLAAVPKQMSLIHLVSQEPAIYNSKHKDYRNIAKKDELWVTMSKQVGWSDSYCKNKWKAIRDQYCRELKRTRTNPNLTIKWRYFKHLEFLRPYALSRNYRQKISTRSNVKQEIPDQEESSTTQEGSILTSNSKENDITMCSMKTEQWSMCESSDQLLDNGDITSQIMLQLAQQEDNKFETVQVSEEGTITQEPQDDEDDDPIHTFLNIESYFEKELITMVHKATVLYNFVHPSYKNAKAKLRVWEEIARKLKKTVRQCRLKWKALRDQYIREHKRLKNMVNGKTVPRWKHYDAMGFLEKFVKERCSTDYNIVTVPKSEMEIPINDFEHEDMMTTTPDSDGNHNNMHQYSIYGDDETTEIYAERLFSSKSTEVPTQSENSLSNGKPEDVLIEEITEATEAKPLLNEDIDDEVGAFFRAVAIKIRNANMSTVAFTELQIDILKTITNALKN